jgi:hypothetical protein
MHSSRYQIGVSPLRQSQPLAPASPAAARDTGGRSTE